jgi:serine/threonine-protein kinase HipA
MSKTGKVYYGSILAGFITESDAGYQFVYHKDYLADEAIFALPGDNRALFVK